MTSTSGGRTVLPRSAHAAGALFLLPFSISLALAVPMEYDPNGFEGVPWGASFNNSEILVKLEDAGWIETYETKAQPPAHLFFESQTFRARLLEGTSGSLF